MTRGEAIIKLIGIKALLEESLSMCGFGISDVFDMAIKALEQEPCEDCISRKEAINVLKADGAEELFRSLGVYPWNAIAMVPSIQPKPKTDEPMQVELEGDGYADGELVYDYGKCPKCGWQFEYGDKDWEELYCCHCGQKLHWFESEG